MEEDYYDDDCPCDNCSDKELCDGWEAGVCAAYQMWVGDGELPDDFDPMDI